MDAERQRRLSEGTRRGMKRSAERRRCPRCERGAALSEQWVNTGSTIRTHKQCRYCGWQNFD